MVTFVAGLDWNIFFQPAFDGSGNYLRFLLVGFEWTLLLSITAWILAFVVGSVVGVLRTFPGKLLPGLGAVYVEVFRNVPLLVQLFLWYFVLPEVIPGLGTWFKQGLSPLLQQFVAGVLCLGFFTAARVASITRAATPSGPSPSMIMPSPTFHRTRPSDSVGLTNRKSYSSSKYHLL